VFKIARENTIIQEKLFKQNPVQDLRFQTGLRPLTLCPHHVFCTRTPLGNGPRLHTESSRFSKCWIRHWV